MFVSAKLGNRAGRWGSRAGYRWRWNGRRQHPTGSITRRLRVQFGAPISSFCPYDQEADHDWNLSL